jgi:DNA replicative helicase MCM subunit Mcm2 (Cdc46/Mcm family)
LERADEVNINQWADYYYYQLGVNVIPADTKNKRTYEKWSQWQLNPLPENIFQEWKDNHRFDSGIAVICGRAWRGVREGKYLTFIDCDNKKAIDEFCGDKTLEQISKDFLVEQHRDNPNKAHIFFFTESFIPKKSSDVLESALVDEKEQVDIPLFEIKSKGIHGIAYVTPSMHKDGYRYEIIGTKDPIVLHAGNTEQMKQRLNSICKKYGLHYLDNVDSSGNTSKVPIEMLYQEEFKVAAGQNRHEHLMRFIESLIKNTKRLNIKNPNPIIRKLAEGFNQTQCSPPLEKKEFDRQWKAAYEFMAKKLSEEAIEEQEYTASLTPEEQKVVDAREKLHAKLIQEFRKPHHTLPIIPMSQLGMDVGDEPVIITGTVIGLSTLVPDWSMVKFVCKSCGKANKADIHDESKPPKRCRFCDVGEQGFTSEVDYTIQPRLNRQTILLQDGSESLSCILTGGQSEMWPVKPGQKVQALGIQRYDTFYNSKTHTSDWRKYFKLLAIKPVVGLDVSYTPHDVEYFKELAASVDNFVEQILVPSFAPQLRGNMNDCKKVCIFTLGSQGIERPFNAALLGPPAKGKTELTYTTAAISHYGNLTEFIHTSIPGLTTETVTDPITNSRIAKPGILATYSVACFTDMNAAVQHAEGKKLLLSMNHALEHKTATSGKAGGAQSFDARCAVLIDSNNHRATWDYDETLKENLKFAPPSFLSRIDLGAVVPKEATEQDYEDIADANLDSYADNENSLKLHQDDWWGENGMPRMGFETLRKFFYYISGQPLPPLDKEEVRKYFKQNYVSVRKNDPELLVDGRYNRTVLILARVITRLAMKPRAGIAELEKAIEFVNKWKNIEVIIPRTGEKDGNWKVYAQSKQEGREEDLNKTEQWIRGCEMAKQQAVDGYFTKMELADILMKMESAKWLDRDVIATHVDRAMEAGKMMQNGNRYTWIGDDE